MDEQNWKAQMDAVHDVLDTKARGAVERVTCESRGELRELQVATRRHERRKEIKEE